MHRIIAFIVGIALLLCCALAYSETESKCPLSDDEIIRIIEEIQAEINHRATEAENAEVEKTKEEETAEENPVEEKASEVKAPEAMATTTKANTPALQLGDNQYSIDELINMCAAINNELSIRNTFDSFDVPVGTWTVGKHLNAGIYSVFTQKKNTSVRLDAIQYQFGESIRSFDGEAESGFPGHLVLKDGDMFEVKYSGVTFKPGTIYPTYEGANFEKSVISFTEYSDDQLYETYSNIMHVLSNQTIPDIILNAGIWVVGKDLPAGTYDIEAFINEKIGNYSFYTYADTTYFQNEWWSDLSMFGFGQSHDTKASNVVLNDGTIIFAKGCMARLNVSDKNVFFGPR